MSNISYRFDIPGFTITTKLNDLNPLYLGEYFQANHADGIKYIVKFGPADKLSKEFEIQLPIDGILKSHHPHRNDMKMAIPYENPYKWNTLKKVIDSQEHIPEKTIIGWAYDILVTLKDLQDYRIYHNNLCLEGSLLCTVGDELHVKLSGLAARKSLSPMESRVPSQDNIITPCSSPEQLNGNPLTRTSDIWNLGVMLYYACSHRYPFTDDTRQLAEILDHYKVDDGLNPLPGEYRNINSIIVREMLRFNEKDRKSPAEILKLPIFQEISGGPMKDGYIVCRSNKAKYDNNYDGGIYHIGQIFELKGTNIFINWYSGRDTVPIPMNDLEVCTRNAPDSGLIPLTVGDKVIRGPDWEDLKHGTNDSNGLGTVVDIVPGFDLDFNTVNVLWPKGRVVRYFYGITSTISTAEILPAYPPIVPGMKVHNLQNHEKFDGIIKSVSNTKDTATILLGTGNSKEMSYGKDDKFDFTIDEIYYKNYAVQSVETYIKNYLDYNNDDDDDGDDDDEDEESKLKSKMLNDFRRNQIGVRDNSIEVGMSVLVPPEIKNCLFCRVIGKTGDTLQLVAVCASYTIPVTKTVRINMVKQCTYGTPTNPPISLDSNIITSEGDNGKVQFITSAPPDKQSHIKETMFHRSWKYAICKMQAGYQCFRFDELNETKGK